MKKVIFILMLISNSVLFGQNSLDQILGITGLRKFVNDSCDCKRVEITYNDFSFLGLYKNTRSYTKIYDNGLLSDNNGHTINYEIQSYIRYLVNNKNFDYKLDTTIKVYFDFGKGAEWRNYWGVFIFEKGLLTRKEFIYQDLKLVQNEFLYEYNSTNKIVRVYNINGEKKKELTHEYFYDSNQNLKSWIVYNNYEKNDTNHHINYFYNESNQVIKIQAFDYGKLYQTLLFEYNEKGLETREAYFNGKGKWEGSYETIYNERNQEKIIYKLNQKGKRKRLITSYEYEY